MFNFSVHKCNIDKNITPDQLCLEINFYHKRFPEAYDFAIEILDHPRFNYLTFMAHEVLSDGMS